MPSHRRRIRLTERDSVYLAVAAFILAVLLTATATTAPQPVEQVPTVQPVPIAGRNPYVAPTGPTPIPPGR